MNPLPDALTTAYGLTPSPVETMRNALERSWNRGELEQVDRFTASAYTPRNVLNPVLGAEGVKQFIAAFRLAFPDLAFEAQETFTSGDRLVVRWALSGVQRGELFGLPPSGRPATLTGISIYRLEDGRAVESWEEINLLGLLYQLGALDGLAA